jgi:DNA-binding IscR family transcriptional regulator
MDVGCALQQTWAEVRDATIAILDNTTFADLVARSGGRWDLIREPVPVSITGAAPRGRVAGGAS